jgi:hypothetical protein
MLKTISKVVLLLALLVGTIPAAELQKGGALVKCDSGVTLGFGPFYAAAMTPEERCGEEPRAVVAQPPIGFVLIFGQRPTNREGLSGVDLRAARTAWTQQLENWGGLVFPGDMQDVSNAENPAALVDALQAGQIPTAAFTQAEWDKFSEFVLKYTFTRPFVYLTYVGNRTQEVTGDPNPGYKALIRFVPVQGGPHQLSTSRFIKSALTSPVHAVTGIQKNFIQAGFSFPPELLSPIHGSAVLLQNDENVQEEE